MPELMGRVGIGTIEVVAVMPRCRDCRWWAEDTDASSGVGICWLASAEEHWSSKARAVIKTQALDQATLMTDADFGCVQWEPRP